jgi:EAL domain-containing protein (putative c-di-GMP-specific phosphodiesterase class I)
MRLVVLDDDESITGFVATVATQRGWAVQTAMQEAPFRAIVSATHPDAILLDLQLGRSDGIEQLQFLKDQGYAGAIVLMSGFDSRVLESARQVGDSLGLTITDVLEKPARAARVREVLESIERNPRVAADTATETTSPPRAISSADVARAIAAGEMELFLQPIVSATTRDVAHAEALIRWRCPTLGLVSPEQFVSVAETDEDVIDRLTMWVAQTAAGHHNQLAALGRQIQVSINVSGSNLRSADFADRLAALLHPGLVPPGAIALEVTETVAMHDLDATTATLARLRLKGFPIAIDDFGTGHSTLTALRRMPFSSIKIDKSFIGDLESSRDSLTIVGSVIRLAQDMKLASVAEGVASANVARLLTDLGIDSLQGFYFSPPLPFDRFTAWLHAWSKAPDVVRA